MINNAIRLTLALVAALSIIMQTPTTIEHDVTTGNFREEAGLDTTQVVAGATLAQGEIEMFCFDAQGESESGWDCFQYHDIPTTDYYQDTDHLVWAGQVKDINAAYERLNPEDNQS